MTSYNAFSNCSNKNSQDKFEYNVGAGHPRDAKSGGKSSAWNTGVSDDTEFFAGRKLGEKTPMSRRFLAQGSGRGGSKFTQCNYLPQSRFKFMFGFDTTL